MNTMATTGPLDPPQTNTNVVGVKRIRKKLQLVAGNGTISSGDILSCLPFIVGAAFRVMKVSVWGSATPGSFLQVQLGDGSVNSDIQTWTDEGTQGSVRPQVHLTPNFDFRNTWIGPSLAGGPIVAATGTAMDLLVVDITLEYRTFVQTCPALPTAEHSLVCSSCQGPSTRL